MMERSPVLALVVVLAVALAAPAAAASLGSNTAPSDGTAPTASLQLATAEQNNSTDNDSVSPGAKLAGVVNVQAAEVSGEVEQRAFGQRIAAANSASAKAEIVAGQTSTLESRLSEIQAKQQTLEQRYENGTISRGQYKARTAHLVAEARTIQRLLGSTSETAATIPDDTLRSKGVNVEALTTLRSNAKALTGPAVSRIAVEIAGANVGNGTSPPGLKGNISIGLPGSLGNGSNGLPGNGSVDMPGVGNGTNITLGTPGNGSPGLGNWSDGPRFPGNDSPGNSSGPGNGFPGNGNGNDTPGLNVSITDSGINVTVTGITDGFF